MREVRAAFGLDHTKGDRAARIEIAKVLLRRDTKPDYDAWKAFREANPVKVKVHISRSEKLASLLAKRKQSLADQQAEHAKLAGGRPSINKADGIAFFSCCFL